MSKRDELIEKYAEDIREKVGQEPDMDLLRRVTIACGPTIYNRDSSTVSTSSSGEMETVKNNWIVKKLGQPDDEHAMGAIQKVADQYGRDNRNKYRAVFYYLLTKHFGAESKV